MWYHILVDNQEQKLQKIVLSVLHQITLQIDILNTNYPELLDKTPSHTYCSKDSKLLGCCTAHLPSVAVNKVVQLQTKSEKSVKQLENQRENHWKQDSKEVSIIHGKYQDHLSKWQW